VQRNPELSGALGHDAMQRSAPNSEATLGPMKQRIRTVIIAEEANTTESTRLIQRDVNAELFKRRNAIREQTFAARLIDRGLVAVDNYDTESTLACSDRGGEPGGTTADYKNFGRFWERLPQG